MYSFFLSRRSQFSSVQSLNRVWLFATHVPQHARLPCPSPVPGVYPNSCPLSQWCHPTTSYLQSFSASGSFAMSQLFTAGGQSIKALASTSVLPMNTQDWSPLGWTGWISLQPSSVIQSCLTPCNPMNHSMLGLPVHCQLPEFTQTHVHWVDDAIQPSYPVVPFSPRPQSFPASGPFQMNQLFTWGGQSIGISVQHQSF